MTTYRIDKKRRPRVEAKVASDFSSAGVEVSITRNGLHVAGWYDSIVGIEGYTIPWAEFDELREWVTRNA